MLAVLTFALAAAAQAQPWGVIETRSSAQAIREKAAFNRAFICPVDDTPIAVAEAGEPPAEDAWRRWDDKFVQNKWDRHDGWGENADRGWPKVVLLFCRAAVPPKKGFTPPPEAARRHG